MYFCLYYARLPQRHAWSALLSQVHVMGLRGFPNVQGGVERHCEMLYPRLVGKGFEPLVYARAHYTPGKKHMHQGVQVIPLPSIKTSGLEAVAHTGLSVLHAKRLGAKLVHIHAIGPAIWTGFAKRLGMRVVVTHHGFDYRRDKWGEAAKKVLQRGEQAAIDQADGIIVISREIEQEILSRAPSGTVSLIPNGVVRPAGIPTTDALSQWGLERHCYALLTARFVKEKRILDLMHAWFRSGIGSRCKLVIAGGEDYPSLHGDEIRALAAKLGVVLTGMVSGNNLATLYAHAAFFVLPSTHEGLPISLLEAMSWNLPVIASDIPANLEVGLDASSYFPVGDVEALASRMVQKAQYLGIRCEYGESMARYDWDEIAERTASLYREVLSLSSDKNWWGGGGRWRLPPFRSTSRALSQPVNESALP